MMINRDTSAPTSIHHQVFSSAFFRRSVSSVYSTSQASINTVLPEYSDRASVISYRNDGSIAEVSDSRFGSSTTQISLYSDIGLGSSSLRDSCPPRYSHINPRRSILRRPAFAPNTPSSPATSISNPSKDEYVFQIRGNKPWFTLRLSNNDSKVHGHPTRTVRKPQHPRLWSSQPIEGVVELDLDSSQTIQQIVLSLKGKIITGYLDSGISRFLNHEVVLWDAKSSTSVGGGLKGKFVGKHEFPFSFPFPSHVDVQSTAAVPRPDTISTGITPFPLPQDLPIHPSEYELNNETKKGKSPQRWSFKKPITAQPTQSVDRIEQRADTRSRTGQIRPFQQSNQSATTNITSTPQTFSETGTAASVSYELTARIVYGRFRAGNKITTNVTYIPSLYPPPASMKRQQSYREGALLVSPLYDPEGWMTLPPITMLGELGGIGGRPVVIECMLYLAKPLSYTRGSAIPCYLEFSSSDNAALDALVTPRTPYVQLVRRIRYSSPQGIEGTNVLEEGNDGLFHLVPTIQDKDSISFTSPSMVKGAIDELKVALHEVAVGFWWVPSKDTPQEPYVRRLEGEIHLPPDLQPTSACTIFSIEYFVKILPLKSAIFLPSAPVEEAMISQSVEITTLYAPDGPVPVVFTKPPPTKTKPLRND